MFEKSSYPLKHPEICIDRLFKTKLPDLLLVGDPPLPHHPGAYQSNEDLFEERQDSCFLPGGLQSAGELSVPPSACAMRFAFFGRFSVFCEIAAGFGFEPK